MEIKTRYNLTEIQINIEELDVILTEKDATLTIGDHGGTITSFQIGDRNILLPQQMVKLGGVLKRRGGSFNPFPWFGPGKNGLPQHGFLRDTILTGSQLEESRGVYELQWRKGFFDTSTGTHRFNWNFDLHTSYEVTEDGFTQLLQITSIDSNRMESMPINFGSHPYIALPDGTAIILLDGQKPIVVAEDHTPYLSKALIMNQPANAVIQIPGLGTVQMAVAYEFAEDSAYTVVWTDDTGYVCVEPVLGSLDNYGTKNGIQLGTGEKLKAKMQITFEPE